MVDKDSIAGCEPHIGEFILVFGGLCDVRSGAFAPLWCALTLEEAYVCVLGPRIDQFGVDGLDDVVDCHVLEISVVARGFN